MNNKLLCSVLAAVVAGCAAQAAKPAKAPPAPAAASVASADAGATLYASTYQVPQSAPVLIRNATVLTGTGSRLAEDGLRREPEGRSWRTGHAPASTFRRSAPSAG